MAQLDQALGGHPLWRVPVSRQTRVSRRQPGDGDKPPRYSSKVVQVGELIDLLRSGLLVKYREFDPANVIAWIE
jgi:hypothetical protein